MEDAPCLRSPAGKKSPESSDQSRITHIIQNDFWSLGGFDLHWRKCSKSVSPTTATAAEGTLTAFGDLLATAVLAQARPHLIQSTLTQCGVENSSDRSAAAKQVESQ